MATPILGAPSLAASQAVPETTVNEIVRFVEQGAAWFRFKDRDLATPPGSPADGDCYLVAASATGAWAGQDGKIAFRLSTAWEFITPSEGMAAWVNDEDTVIVFDGSAWNVFTTGTSYTDEMARDAVAAMLVAGSNITLTYDDGADTLTVASTGGGGGGGDQHIEVAMSDLYSELAAGANKASWVVPYDFTLSEVFTAVTTAQSTSGAVTINIRIKGGSTIFTTPPSIDANEDTSLTGTAAVLATTALTKGQILLFDLDADGTGAKGLVAVLVGTPA